MTSERDFPGGPEADSVLPKQGVWVWSLVRELDPTAATKSLHAKTKIPPLHATTEDRVSCNYDLVQPTNKK